MTFAELVELAGTSEWQEAAACHGRTSLFYAEDQWSQRIACAICQTCPVRSECLDEARATEDPARRRYGVRGGLTPAERGRPMW